jgi:hypothetical protein
MVIFIPEQTCWIPIIPEVGAVSNEENKKPIQYNVDSLAVNTQFHATIPFLAMQSTDIMHLST